MPHYSSKLVPQLIEPSWKLIVLELSLYTEQIIFNKKIVYSEDEQIKMEDENHNYNRNYESDDESETYGMEGLIFELIDFAVDLLKRKGVLETLKSMLLTFLLCIKGYCLLPENLILLWKNEINYYINDEFEEENINSIRNKTINLIKEITQELDDDSLMRFLKILISEFMNGINIDDYSEVVKLDDYNFIQVYFDNLKKNKKWLLRNQEANLFILGILSEDLVLLRDKGRIPSNEINQFLEYLLIFIKSSYDNLENKCSKMNYNLIIGRSIWCINKMLSLIRYDKNMLIKTFESITSALIRKDSNKAVTLLASLCLSNVSQKLINIAEQEKNMNENNENSNLKSDIDKQVPIYDSESFIEILKTLIILLKEASNNNNEEVLIVIIETIYDLTILNKEKALFIPYNNTKLFVDIYSKYYNHNTIGTKILELIKLWCSDKQSASLLLTLFVPFAFFVFDDFFKSLGKDSKNFEEIKKTVMTEHGNNDMNFKTSLEMLPVNNIFNHNKNIILNITYFPSYDKIIRIKKFQ